MRHPASVIPAPVIPPRRHSRLPGNDGVVVQCITVDFRLFRHVGGERKVVFAALMRLRRQIGFEAKPKSKLPDARSGSPVTHLCKR